MLVNFGRLKYPLLKLLVFLRTTQGLMALPLWWVPEHLSCLEGNKFLLINQFGSFLTKGQVQDLYGARGPVQV